MSSPNPAGDWTPPADPPTPGVADAPVTEAPVMVVPPAPDPAAAPVTTGPVAEAPVPEPAPVAADPPAADPAGTTADASDSAPGSTTDEESGVDEPDPTLTGSGEPVPVVQTASNASQGIPEQSARTAAAKAFHILGRIADVCREVQAELQKHVPPEVLQAAEADAVVLFRTLI